MAYIKGIQFSGSNNEDPKLKKKEKKPETETARVLSESDRSDSHEVGHRKERRETRLKKNDNNICAEEGESKKISVTMHTSTPLQMCG